MRTDVKLGLIGSLVVVVIAGWYFARQDEGPPAIPLQGNDRPVTPSAFTGLASDEGDADVPGGGVAEMKTESDVGRRVDAPGETLADLFDNEPDSPRGNLGDREDDHAETAPGFSPGEQADETTPPVSNHPVSEARSVTKRPAPGVRTETHTVRPGDTMAGLARMYYGDVRYSKLLRDANPQVVDPRAIAVGTVVVIPDADGLSPAAKSGSTSAPSTPTVAGTRTYTVQEGDTLYNIARRHLGAGSRWDELHKLNKTIIGDDPGLLRVGQVLTLPRK